MKKFISAFALIICMITACGGGTNTDTELLPSPKAGFTHTVDGDNSLKIKFSNSSENATSYSWDFGDQEGTSVGTNPTYTYTSAGTYNVTLTAKNSAGASDSKSIAITVAAQPTKEWTLVWGDEFDYSGLPDETKWNYYEGFVRNEERQYYTRARLENVSIADGLLTITGMKEQYPNAAYEPGSTDWKKKDEFASYTSANLITKGKFSFTYGKVEVRARLPKGLGVWPAIWTLGDNEWEVGWPECGEIDIMEHVGFEPNTIHTNVHYENPAGEYKTQMTGRTVTGISDDFHVYSMEWDEEKITILVDGLVHNTFTVELAGDVFK